MHRDAKLLSLEQRRQLQLLSLMFIYKEQHINARRGYNRRTRAADRYSVIREVYNCVKYKKSPYYKGSIIWDNLTDFVRDSTTLLEFKKRRTVYVEHNELMS